MSQSAVIEGAVATGFEPVRQAFEQNFTLYGEVGASFGLYVDGELKVDLWGGTADVTTGRLWSKDTIALVYSVSKGITATLMSLLAQRGELDLDANVASIWPEFAANGKQKITIRQVLSHQAGLPAVLSNFTREQVLLGTPLIDELATLPPVWKPGTSHGYHALTFGWLTGEIVRRATGRSMGSLVASELSDPLSLDLHIGLARAEHRRVAPLIDPAPLDLQVLESIVDPEALAAFQRAMAALQDPTSLLSRAMSTNGALPAPHAETWNDARMYEIEQPAVNAITNGRSLAKLYGACVAPVGGVRILSDATLDDVTAEQLAGPDEVMGTPARFASGYQLPTPAGPMLSPASFGHVGASGALGFADRTHRVGFGYVQNQGAGSPVDPRTSGLIEAVKVALGIV